MWRRKWQPTPVFLPGESHRQRSLAGYSPRGCKESDMTKRLHFHFHFHCILDSFVDYDGFSISSKGFLPTVVDIMVIELNSPIPVHFSLLIPKNVDDHSCHFLFDHFQFALIYGPIIPDSYAILLFTASDFHHQSHLQLDVFVFLFSFVSVSSFFLELFLH